MSLMGAYSKDNYLTRDEMRKLDEPQKLGRWHQPVPFADLMDITDDELRMAGLVITSEEHYLHNKGKAHFGIMTIGNGDGDLGGSGWKMQLGVKGSHDQSTAPSLVAGRHVTVCSNGMFTGELGKVSTKQSTNVWDRLRDMVRGGVEKLESAWRNELVTIEQLRAVQMRLQHGDAVLADMYRHGGLTAQSLARALDEWVAPTYEEHAVWGQSLWLLEQSVTEALKPTGHKGVSPHTLADRTMTVRPLIQDAYYKLAA